MRKLITLILCLFTLFMLSNVFANQARNVKVQLKVEESQYYLDSVNFLIMNEDDPSHPIDSAEVENHKVKILNVTDPNRRAYIYVKAMVRSAPSKDGSTLKIDPYVTSEICFDATKTMPVFTYPDDFKNSKTPPPLSRCK